jgi:hypothetical protein
VAKEVATLDQLGRRAPGRRHRLAARGVQALGILQAHGAHRRPIRLRSLWSDGPRSSTAHYRWGRSVGRNRASARVLIVVGGTRRARRRRAPRRFSSARPDNLVELIRILRDSAAGHATRG